MEIKLRESRKPNYNPGAMTPGRAPAIKNSTKLELRGYIVILNTCFLITFGRSF